MQAGWDRGEDEYGEGEKEYEWGFNMCKWEIKEDRTKETEEWPRRLETHQEYSILEAQLKKIMFQGEKIIDYMTCCWVQPDLKIEH